MQKLKNKKSGFTLIELMIVVAILGILAAVAIPAFATYIRRSKTSEVAGNIEGMFKAISAYYNKEHTPAVGTIQGTAVGHCIVAASQTFPVASVGDQKVAFAPTVPGSFAENGGIGYTVGMSYYSYTNRNQATLCSATPAQATGQNPVLVAVGDLDADNTSAEFSLPLAANDGNEFYKAGQLFVSNELE